MRRLISLAPLCVALVLAGCIGGDVPFGSGAAASGAPTSISGVSGASASAWTTPPPPGYQVQRPVVLQPVAPIPVQPAPIQPPPLPTQPPSAAPTSPQPELPSWTPPVPPPVEEAPDAGTGSGCGGGGKG